MALTSCQSQNMNNHINNSTMITDNKLNLNELKSVVRTPGAEEYRDLTGKVANGTAYFYRQSVPDENGHIAIYGDNDGYEKLVVDKNAYFLEFYSFDNDGKLLNKGLMYPEGFKKGTWLYYDENSKIKEEIDYDKPFKFSWENVLTYLNKRGIKKESIAYIKRDAKTNPKIWTIEWNMDTETAELIVLNGDTGKVIEISKHPIKKEI